MFNKNNLKKLYNRFAVRYRALIREDNPLITRSTRIDIPLELGAVDWYDAITNKIPLIAGYSHEAQKGMAKLKLVNNKTHRRSRYHYTNLVLAISPPKLQYRAQVSKGIERGKLEVLRGLCERVKGREVDFTGVYRAEVLDAVKIQTLLCRLAKIPPYKAGIATVRAFLSNNGWQYYPALAYRKSFYRRVVRR